MKKSQKRWVRKSVQCIYNNIIKNEKDRQIGKGQKRRERSKETNRERESEIRTEKIDFVKKKEDNREKKMEKKEETKDG